MKSILYYHNIFIPKRINSNSIRLIISPNPPICSMSSIVVLPRICFPSRVYTLHFVGIFSLNLEFSFLWSTWWVQESFHIECPTFWICWMVSLKYHLPCSSAAGISCELEFRSRDLLRVRLNILEARILPEWCVLHITSHWDAHHVRSPSPYTVIPNLMFGQGVSQQTSIVKVRLSVCS